MSDSSEKGKKADDDDGWGASERGKGEKLLVKINCFLF